MKLRTIIQWLEELSPLQYAEDWDNVGLLLGDEDQEIHHIMIALDASDYVIEQAVRQKVDLLLTHHPMIFRAVKQLNNHSLTGRRIWKLATNGTACYAMHTNFDIKGGMAELAGERLELLNPQPLEITTGEGESAEGIGRVGNLDQVLTVKELAEQVKERFHIPHVMVYGDVYQRVSRVAIAPGSGKSEISHALDADAGVLITGDIGHHEGMDAVDMGLAIIDATHHGLEHIFIDFMADYIQRRHAGSCENYNPRMRGGVEALKEDNTNELVITVMDTGSPVAIL